jgi:hypothetical protein
VRCSQLALFALQLSNAGRRKKPYPLLYCFNAARPEQPQAGRCKPLGRSFFSRVSQRRHRHLELLHSKQDLPVFRLIARANIDQFDASAQVL